MTYENDNFDDNFDFFLIFDPEIADIARGDEEEDKEEKIKLMKKIEKKYINGIKSFGERMFQTIENDNIKLDEINIDFNGDLSTRLNFGIFQIGGGTGTSIAFKLKKK